MAFKRYLSLNLPEGQSAFLWGGRKTGKSTFLKEAFPKALHIDLLRADVFQHYVRRPQGLREELKSITDPFTVIVDEVQKIPILLDEIHGLIEDKKNLQFILCGSSARKLKQTGANLLGGRAWRYMFVPLCYPELKELNWDFIFNRGLIPSHYLSPSTEQNLTAYLYDYILTEVHAEANIRKRETFTRFLDILGFCHGTMINFSNIARDCGVSSKTVMTYFEILEDMYLGYFLRPYRTRSSRQIIQETPKFYLFDTGLANYLKRYTFKEMRGMDAGASFEHYVFLELMAYKLLTAKRDSIYYWRTKDKHEVDFIIQDMAFEVKISTPIEKKDLKNLVVFAEENKASLHVISLEPRKRIMTCDNKEVTIWPIQEFLEELWSHTLWT
jgi:predicted AAA+ superfamily ATPase